METANPGDADFKTVAPPAPKAEKRTKPKKKAKQPTKAKTKKRKAVKSKPARKLNGAARSERLDMRLTKAQKTKINSKAKKTRRTVTSLIIEAIEKIR